ncbi:MAG: hypothetical protein C0475_06385 [Planctomyces sp.]|nr:hypothetical protein [Planctomyces sp.]MBA4119666.1 hypothetical protein [Isosphaera sp.]
MPADLRVISIGALAAHPLWNERAPVRTGQATCTLVRTPGPSAATIVVDPGLPPAAMAARLAERAGISADAVTHVFLTSYHPDTHRGIELFEHAQWLISAEEREGVGVPLVHRLRLAVEEGQAEAARLLERQVALLQRCQAAPDTLAPGVDLFPLPGVTPGMCGLLIEDRPEGTALVCGDAVATVEHLQRGMVLPHCADVGLARQSFAEAVQIADLLVLGRDNAVMNPGDDVLPEHARGLPPPAP